MKKIALVGCGAVTELSHLPAFSALGVIPAVCVDRDMQRAQEIAERFGIAAAAASVAEIPEGIDAALVAVPPAFHCEVAVEFMQRGIHVLVEKPLAISADEGEKMVRAADDNGVSLSVGLMRRRFESGQWVRGLLASGELGPVTTFRFEEGAPYAWPIATDSGFRRDSAGGGVLMDTGSHTLDQLQWWLGDFRVLEYRDDNFGGVEADCLAQVELASGACGSVELSRTRLLANSARIECERGTIEVDLGDDRVEVEPAEFAKLSFDDRRGDRLRPKSYDDLFMDQLKGWMQTIGGVEGACVPAREALATLRVIQSCYEIRQPMEMSWLQPETTPGTDRC